MDFVWQFPSFTLTVTHRSEKAIFRVLEIYFVYQYVFNVYSLYRDIRNNSLRRVSMEISTIQSLQEL